MEKILEQLRKEARGIVNTTAHFMKLAENYMAEDNVGAARACLLLLCENCDNYEESIEWNGLTEQWQHYRYLVADLVPPSIKIISTEPLLPAQCTMQIADILSLPDDEILSALSDHLGELSGNGDAINTLNKWERTIYYVDELCVEVNSGGFGGYLYYHGQNFEEAKQALQTIGAQETLALLERIQGKFPRKKIPKDLDRIQDVLDKLEDKDVDFEAEDECYYESAEKELLQKLREFATKNGGRFR